MEIHRSFAVKRIRFLVFSLGISFSFVFLTFFFFWVIKATPSYTRQAQQHVQYKETPRNSSLKLSSFTAQSLSGFNGDLSPSEVKSSVLTDDNLSTAGIVSELAGISAEFPRKENVTREIVVAGEVKLGDNDTLSNGTGGALFDPEVYAVASKKPEINPISERPLDLGAELYRGDNLSRDLNSSQPNVADTPSSEKAKSPWEDGDRIIEEGSNNVCDITEGKWVFDQTYPLYRNTTCPFIDEGFNCEGNGRSDKDYMKWRWQPRDCDIPRFNATKMLELIRGKRLVFVGDSINRNQWESMLCLLMGAVKGPKKVYETHGRRITKEKGNYCFKFVDYKCTVEYYVTHFLVHESKARVGKKRVQTLRIDAIEKGSSRWRGADILVFNSAHWWSHHKTKAGVNYYQEGDQVHPHLDVSVAFRRALVTWASWIDKYVNPRKTQVFFRSSAPSHFSGGQWNTGGHCRDVVQPTDAIPVGGSVKNTIVEEVLRQMKTPVTFLNITGMSSYRVDGHPSIFGRSISSGVQDCSHWCLPGVPDSWNEMLYYHLVVNGRTSSTNLK